MNKQKQLQRLNQRFKHIDYSKIPYSDSIPNQTTLKALKSKINIFKNK